jgi:hypothetical protein
LVPAAKFQVTDLKLEDFAGHFVQLYAGKDLNCGWLLGLNIVDPTPTYALPEEAGPVLQIGRRG